jgi:Xaa-Pro dipeptidase
VSSEVLMNRDRARALLSEAGVDGIVAGTLENVYYASGVWSENFEVLPRMTQLYVVLAADALERPRIVAGVDEAANICDAGASGGDLYYHGRFFRYVNEDGVLDPTSAYVKREVIDGEHHGSLIDAAVAAVHDAGLASGVIAYDERGMFEENVAELRKRLPDARLVPGWRLWKRIRAVKTAEEQRRLTAAARVAERAVVDALATARAGVTEAELIEAYEHSVLASGARPTFAQIAIGVRSATGYVMRRRAPLGERDIVRLDVGCRVEGYHSDIARNFCLRDPGERAHELHAAMVAGQEASIAALRPGASVRDVVAAGIDAVRAAGVAGYDRHHVGHGLGLDVYDFPVLNRAEEAPVEEGMVLSVELPYYELGYGGLQPEDTVIVGRDGAWVVTETRSSLEVRDA